MDRKEKILKCIYGQTLDKKTCINRDGTIDLKQYKRYKKEGNHTKDAMSLYTKSNFKITEVNKEGYITLSKGNNHHKVLIRKEWVKDFSIGDVISCELTKKIFFVYWEFFRINNVTLI